MVRVHCIRYSPLFHSFGSCLYPKLLYINYFIFPFRPVAWQFLCQGDTAFIIWIYSGANPSSYSLKEIYPQPYWNAIDTWYCVSLKCPVYWLDTFAYCKMITTVALADASNLSHNCHFCFVVRTFVLYFLGNIQVHNTVLLVIITMFCIQFPELNWEFIS